MQQCFLDLQGSAQQQVSPVAVGAGVADVRPWSTKPDQHTNTAYHLHPWNVTAAPGNDQKQAPTLQHQQSARSHAVCLQQHQQLPWASTHQPRHQQHPCALLEPPPGCQLACDQHSTYLTSFIAPGAAAGPPSNTQAFQIPKLGGPAAAAESTIMAHQAPPSPTACPGQHNDSVGGVRSSFDRDAQAHPGISTSTCPSSSSEDSMGSGHGHHHLTSAHGMARDDRHLSCSSPRTSTDEATSQDSQCPSGSAHNHHHQHRQQMKGPAGEGARMPGVATTGPEPAMASHHLGILSQQPQQQQFALPSLCSMLGAAAAVSSAPSVMTGRPEAATSAADLRVSCSLTAASRSPQAAGGALPAAPAPALHAQLCCEPPSIVKEPLLPAAASLAGAAACTGPGCRPSTAAAASARSQPAQAAADAAGDASLRVFLQACATKSASMALAVLDHANMMPVLPVASEGSGSDSAGGCSVPS